MSFLPVPVAPVRDNASPVILGTSFPPVNIFSHVFGTAIVVPVIGCTISFVSISFVVVLVPVVTVFFVVPEFIVILVISGQILAVPEILGKGSMIQVFDAGAKLASSCLKKSSKSAKASHDVIAPDVITSPESSCPERDHPDSRSVGHISLHESYCISPLLSASSSSFASSASSSSISLSVVSCVSYKKLSHVCGSLGENCSTKFVAPSLLRYDIYASRSKLCL